MFKEPRRGTLMAIENSFILGDPWCVTYKIAGTFAQTPKKMLS